MHYTSQDELKLAMDLIDETVTENRLNILLKMADVDNDGRINYEGNQQDRLKFSQHLY